MKKHTFKVVVLSLLSFNLLAGGFPARRPVAKKEIDLNSKVLEIFPDFSVNGQNGARNIDVSAINQSLADDVSDLEDQIILDFSTRFSGSPSIPRFSFIAIDHSFFSMSSIFLQDFDFKRVSDIVMGHMFSLSLPIDIKLNFFIKDLRNSLAEITIPREDKELRDNFFERVISEKGKIKILISSRLVLSTLSNKECIATLENSINLVDFDGSAIPGGSRFSQGINEDQSSFVVEECHKLGLTNL